MDVSDVQVVAALYKPVCSVMGDGWIPLGGAQVQLAGASLCERARTSLSA